MFNSHVYQFSVATVMQYDKIVHIYFCLHISDQSLAQQSLLTCLQSAEVSGLVARQLPQPLLYLRLPRGQLGQTDCVPRVSPSVWITLGILLLTAKAE